MKRKQSGFTLIEIAIVLVIIGLLLGGVLKGQELITSARVRNIISQQDGVKAAYYGFQDRYRAIPGDYTGVNAKANIPNIDNDNVGGNGDGVINNETGTRHESVLAWTHLSRAGFITGNYNATTAAPALDDQAFAPVNPYNARLQIIYDAIYEGSGGANPRVNLKTGNQIPVEIMAEIDRKIDDGTATTGSFRFSEYNGGTAAPVGSGTCFVAGTGIWNATGGQANCGGVSIF